MGLGFNLKWIKKSLKTKYPGLFEYINDYLKQNKDLKNTFYEHPDYFLQVYEDFLKNNEDLLESNQE